MAKRTRKSRSSGKRPRGRSSRKNLPMLLGVGAVIVLLVGLVVVRIVQSVGLPGERFASQGNLHISLTDDHPPYNSDPPTSGWHTPDLAGWGAYSTVMPDERLVHNMEDGGVILWYRLGTPEENEANIDALQEVARGFSRHVIAPREDMETPYALTAWQRLQRFEEIEPDGMRAFLDAYHGIDHHAAF